MSRSSYIIAAVRTPIGRLLGGLSAVPAPQLAAVATREALVRSGCEPSTIDEVIVGNVLSAGVGQAPARQAALLAGIPASVPALTINKVCGSGLKAVMLADQAIRCGDAKRIVAGGMESMSLAPHLAMGTRRGWKFGSQTLVDAMQHDGLSCSIERLAMGQIADETAERYGIAREDQDRFAVESHRRALEAQRQGWFDDEIISVETPPARKGERPVFSSDEGPRSDVNGETLAQLRPAFGDGGTATAGNSSQISDGAAAVVVVDEETARRARETGNCVAVRIVATASVALAPRDLFLAPVEAIRRLCEKARVTLPDVELVELNEAFASQAIACIRELSLDPQRVNVHGGAIALGHPIGASGTRILVTLLHAMRRRGARTGIASLCLGGGGAVAMLFESVE